MSSASNLGPGGSKCTVFEILAFLINSACWRKEYFGGAQRFVFVLKRGRKGFGWPWGLGWASASVKLVFPAEGSGLGMGAR